MTEWHARYGGRGVMIYWHVERGSVCIHSRLRRCSSSEVAAMIEGVLRHDTEMEVERQYVDSHGQSEVAFGFCRLLGFHLLPRLKAIAAQRLYPPASGAAPSHPNLGAILARPIDWELIEGQYDEMVRYATAMAERTADPEAILRRFTRANAGHPTYRALAELGKAAKTVFLCRYLGEAALRRRNQDLVGHPAFLRSPDGQATGPKRCPSPCLAKTHSFAVTGPACHAPSNARPVCRPARQGTKRRDGQPAGRGCSRSSAPCLEAVKVVPLGPAVIAQPPRRWWRRATAPRAVSVRSTQRT
jgi:hypothetical protein